MTKTLFPALTSTLTSAQTTVLAAALRHPLGAVLLPDRLKGKAASIMVASLIAKGAAREVRAKAGLPAWRRDDVTRIAYALVITKAGRVAMASSGQAAPAAVNVARSAPVTTTQAAHRDQRLEESETDLVERECAEPAPIGVSGPSRASSLPRPDSKLSGIVGLLVRETGASMDELIAATGWLPHTTRAALTGLRKRGYAVMREAGPAGSVYRISAAAQSAAA